MIRVLNKITQLKGLTTAKLIQKPMLDKKVIPQSQSNQASIFRRIPALSRPK
ncbi:MAG: hypothetical protein FKGGLIKP_00603 [Sodalis sp. Fse]|nr:MAG: hypothetical protein FKGGLIKP_00603 [Sodalis sp. Fse]